jgi:S1-C subfamily serine protease
MLGPTRRPPDDDPISYPRDEATLDAHSRAVATVVERVGPAVVRVESVAKGRWRGGLGSGLIIAGDARPDQQPRYLWRQARAPLVH